MVSWAVWCLLLSAAPASFLTLFCFVLGKEVDKLYQNASLVQNKKMLYLKVWMREIHIPSFCLASFVCLSSNTMQIECCDGIVLQ